LRFFSDHSFGKRYALRGGRYVGYSPQLDPERQMIYFGCPTMGKLGEICMVGMDGQQLTVLTNTEYYVGQPALSLDGTKIAFVAEPGHSAPSIHVLELNSGQIQRITRPAFRDDSPLFSPDGQRIAFARHMSPDADAAWSREIFIAAVDGTAEQRLTHNAVAETPIAFSQDGKHLYFAGVDADLLNRRFEVRNDLYRMEIETGDVEMILPLKTRGAAMAVSHDEKFVAYVDDRDFAYDVFLYDLEASEVRQLTRLGGLIQSVSFARGRNDLITCEIEPRRGHPQSIADIMVIHVIGPEVVRISWSSERE
jgi:Tol biopolymer transport system component